MPFCNSVRKLYVKLNVSLTFYHATAQSAFLLNAFIVKLTLNEHVRVFGNKKERHFWICNKLQIRLPMVSGLGDSNYGNIAHSALCHYFFESELCESLDTLYILEASPLLAWSDIHPLDNFSSSSCEYGLRSQWNDWFFWPIGQRFGLYWRN